MTNARRRPLADRIGGGAAIVNGLGIIGYAALGAGTEPAVRDVPAYFAVVTVVGVAGILTISAGIATMLGVRFARPAASVLAGLAAIIFGVGGAGNRATAVEYAAVYSVVITGLVAVVALGYGRYLAN